MKVAILLSLVALVSAGGHYSGATFPGYGQTGFLGSVGVVNTGSSNVQRSEDGLGNYQFAYSEQGGTGASSRSETGDAAGRKQGSYSFQVADGRVRNVEYVADEYGFRANIQTNEPGTNSDSPAATSFFSANGASPTAHLAAERTAQLLAAPAAPAFTAQTLAAPALAAPVLATPTLQATSFAAPALSAPIFRAASPAYTARAFAAPVLSIGLGGLAAPVLAAGSGLNYASSVQHIAAPRLSSPIFSSIQAAPALTYAAAPQAFSLSAAAPALRALPALQTPRFTYASAPIAQQQIIAAPQPISFSNSVSHISAAPQPIFTVAQQPQIIAAAPQQIISAAPQQIIAAPRPVSFSSSVSHISAAPQILAAPQPIAVAQPAFAPIQRIAAAPLKTISVARAPLLATQTFANPLPAYHAAASSGVKGGWH